jgi:hypothetical protein
MAQVWHSPQKVERPPFWNGCSHRIKNYGLEVTLNGMTFLANFIKKFPVGSQVDGGGGGQADRQNDIISLHFSFRKESRLETEAEVLKRASKMSERTAYFGPKT